MPTSGSRVGRYELRERLGAGGMGEVFRARDRELGRDVAIKFLPAGYASDPARLARFGAEARAASALNHPNILTIHDVGEESGRQFIVMECVEGKTLRRLLHDRPLTPRQALDIAVQLADGLAKAHAAGIVHRDLKPENVMVTADGLVKIVDFGLARPSPGPGSPAGGHDSTETRVRGEWPETAEGTVLGTVGYMSPEQARGERVDHRSDQFALGAILYEMATGRRAFHGETSMDTLAAIIDREPEPIAGLNPSFPAPARWPIERCLAKRPADRYAVTEDLARELRTVRDHLGETTVSQPVTGKRPRRGAALRRWGLAGAAVLLIAGAFAVGLVGPSAWRRFWRPPLPSEIRLAVLPVSVPAAEADCCGGLAEYVSGRLVELGRLGRRVSVVPAVEVLSAGVTAPSAARRVLGATLVVTIAVNRSGDNYLVSVGLAETAPVREIVADTRTFPRGSYSPEEVANLVLPLLDLQLATAERSAWNGGAPAVARAGVLYAKGLALTPYQQAQGKLEQYDQARSLETAIKLFNDAIDLDPRYAAAHADLGAARLRLYRLTRNPEELSLAAQSARQALDLDATRPGAWMTLGMVSAQQGNLEEAQKNFDAAIARNPQGAETYRELGLACQRAGLWEKAEAAYRKAIELEPAAWPNHNYLGSFLFARRRLPEAEAEFKLALTMAPDNARVWSNLGGVYLAEQRWDEAESALTASSRAGAYGPALSNLGYLQMQARRQYAEAARTFERATGVAPRDSRIWMNLASARLFAGQRDGASDAYRRAAALLEEERRIDPTNTATLVALAACYAGTGDAGRARSAVGQALRGQIAAEDWTGVVGVFETLGDRAAALRQVDAALRAGVAPADFEQDATFDVLRKDPRYGAIVRAHTSRTNGGRR